MGSTAAIGQSVDLSHHINQKSRSRHSSPLKDIIKLMGVEGMVSLAGGGFTLIQRRYRHSCTRHESLIVVDNRTPTSVAVPNRPGHVPSPAMLALTDRDRSNRRQCYKQSELHSRAGILAW